MGGSSLFPQRQSSSFARFFLWHSRRNENMLRYAQRGGASAIRLSKKETPNTATGEEWSNTPTLCVCFAACARRPTLRALDQRELLRKHSKLASEICTSLQANSARPKLLSRQCLTVKSQFNAENRPRAVFCLISALCTNALHSALYLFSALTSQ